MKQSLLIAILALGMGISMNGQSLYVGDGGQFYLSANASSSFTTSGSTIATHANGSVVFEAGGTWTTTDEYVVSGVTLTGSGTTVANIGVTNQTPITITTTSDDEVTVVYSESAPTGSVDPSLSGYQLSDTEFWTITSVSGSSTDVQATSATESSSATYNGFDSNLTTLLVRFNTNTNQWEDYASSPGFGDFALATFTTALLADIDVILQGPYDINSGIMNDDLRTGALLPTDTPYGDEVSVASTVFDATGNDAIVDWVTVELRDASDISSVLYTTSALLQRDGDIVGLDGTSSLALFAPLASYYISVNHRNHVAIATSAVVSLSTTTSTVDLTQAANINGGILAASEVVTGIYAMFAGDSDGNNQVQTADSSLAAGVVGQSGYIGADSNMNGQVQTTDLSLFIAAFLGSGIQF